MNKKQVLVLILIVALFLGGILFLISIDKKNKSKYFYLFSGDSKIVRWYYTNKTWYIMNQNTPLDEKFDVYSYGINKGKYNLVFSKKWYYFDDNNDSHDIDGIKYMINTNYDFKSYEFLEENSDDEDVESEIFKEMGLSQIDYNIRLMKYIIEDNENINTVYSAGFYKNQDEYSPLGPSYTVAFLIDKGKLKIISNLSFDTEDAESCQLGLVGLFNFENRDKILVNCSHFDQIPSDYYLYDAKSYDLLVASEGGN